MSVVTGAFGNRLAIQTGQKNVAVAGTGEVLGTGPVPNGFYLTIKAKTSNAGTIYLGSSKANSENHAVAFSLTAGQSVTLGVLNLNAVWLDASVAGNGVEYLAEA